MEWLSMDHPDLPKDGTPVLVRLSEPLTHWEDCPELRRALPVTIASALLVEEARVANQAEIDAAKASIEAANEAARRQFIREYPELTQRPDVRINLRVNVPFLPGPEYETVFVGWAWYSVAGENDGEYWGAVQSNPHRLDASSRSIGTLSDRPHRRHRAAIRGSPVPGQA